MSTPHANNQGNGPVVAVRTRDADCTILECPRCQCTCGGVIRSNPPRAKCVACSHIYNITTFPPSFEPDSRKRKRKGTPGFPDGVAKREVTPVSPPDPKDLGTLTRYTQEILQGGPRSLIAAQHKAAKLSQLFGEEFESHWCLATPYLRQILSGVDPALKEQPDDQIGRYSMIKRNRARARYALSWRPRFLAIFALSKSPLMAARAAGVAINTVRKHRAADPDFELQYEEAEEHALQLLHDVTMKSAIEGECEPVFWQGIPVGHIRKVDNRLRIEMLRAHMPKTFKTPGAKVAINAGNVQNNFICSPEEQDELIVLRQQALERMKPAQVTEIPVRHEVDATT